MVQHEKINSLFKMLIKIIKNIVVGVILVIFSFNLSLADKHHYFFICKELPGPGATNWEFELEIDFKKNKAFIDGYSLEIGEKDELYIYAKKKVDDKLNMSFNMNRFTGKLNLWERDEGTFSFNCKKLKRQL